MEEKFLPLKRNEPLMDEDGEVVRLMTEKPPAHCILKIDSFSAIQDASIFKLNEDHFKSLEFNAGGYKWVLSVRPKGKKLEQGDEHISLYVTLVDKLASGSFVDVVLRLFVYDHLRNAYLSVLDVREKRYHALKDTWGVPKFLPISTFSDADYGFLVDDCCVFGAEVLVINTQVKISTMSIVEAEFVKSYTWRIENFSLSSDRLSSPVFCLGGWSWKLTVCKKGDRNVNGEYLSLFLQLDNISELTHGNKLYVEYFLNLENQGEGENHIKLCYTWFSASDDNWGCPAFISLSDLHDSSKGYLVDDAMIVEVCVEKMFMLKDIESAKEQEQEQEDEEC